MNAKPSSAWLVEVVTTWGDTVVSVRHLRAGERFVIDANNADSISEFSNNLNTWSLAGVSLDGRCWVELPPEARYAVESTESGEAQVDRAAASGEAFELAEGLRVRCVCGSLVFAVRMCRDERALLARTKDTSWRVAFATSLALVASTLTSFESQHRAFDSELVERSRDDREARLRALIERWQRPARIEQRPQETQAQLALTAAPSETRERIYTGSIPPGRFFAPFEARREQRGRYGIFALVMYFDEGGFAGLSQGDFAPIATPDPWSELLGDVWSPMSTMAWSAGIGGVLRFDAETHQPTVAMSVHSKLRAGPSDARVAAAHRLAPAVRRCYIRALEHLGLRAGTITVSLDYSRTHARARVRASHRGQHRRCAPGHLRAPRRARPLLARRNERCARANLGAAQRRITRRRAGHPGRMTAGHPDISQ